MTNRFFGLLIVLWFMALHASDPLASAQRAIRVLERGIEAHGGRSAQDQLKLSIAIRSDWISEQQSLVALPPFESYPMRIDIAIDQPAGRLRVEQQSAIAGDFIFGDLTIMQNGKGFSIAPEMKSYREVSTEPGILNRFLPHRVLQSALQNRAALRWIGQENGADIVSTVSPGGVSTLHIDRKTGLLRRIQQVIPFGVFGDGSRELVYEGYRTVGGIALPSRLVATNRNSVHGVVENIYRYESVTTDFEITPKQLELPQGYTKPDYSYRGSFVARKLSDDLYLLENVTSTTGQWSYNVLVVVFDEFVLVGEAPVSSATTEAVLRKIAELAPGKPVRYLVQSHHHGDHLGGIRAYVAGGSTILAGASAKKLIEKIVAAPFDLDPDRLRTNPRAPRVEVVEDSKTIRDANHQVVVHNIGPSPHAADMLFLYLPEEQILYQSDLVNDGEYPENETTRDFQRKLEKLGLKYRLMAGLHGRIRENQ